jgi:hypothetical protein
VDDTKQRLEEAKSAAEYTHATIERVKRYKNMGAWFPQFGQMERMMGKAMSEAMHNYDLSVKAIRSMALQNPAFFHHTMTKNMNEAAYLSEFLGPLCRMINACLDGFTTDTEIVPARIAHGRMLETIEWSYYAATNEIASIMNSSNPQETDRLRAQGLSMFVQEFKFTLFKKYAEPGEAKTLVERLKFKLDAMTPNEKESVLKDLANG